MRAKQIKTTSTSKQEESNRVATKVWQHFAVTIKVKKTGAEQLGTQKGEQRSQSVVSSITTSKYAQQQQ